MQNSEHDYRRQSMPCVLLVQSALTHPEASRARAQLHVLTRHPKCKRALMAVLQQLSQEAAGFQLATLVEQQHLGVGGSSTSGHDHELAPGASSVCASLVTLRTAFKFLVTDIFGTQRAAMKPVYKGFSKAWSSTYT